MQAVPDRRSRSFVDCAPSVLLAEGKPRRFRAARMDAPAQGRLGCRFSFPVGAWWHPEPVYWHGSSPPSALPYPSTLLPEDIFLSGLTGVGNGDGRRASRTGAAFGRGADASG